MFVGFTYKRDTDGLYSINVDKEVMMLLVDNFEGMTETLVSEQEFGRAYEMLACRQKLVEVMEETDE